MGPTTWGLNGPPQPYSPNSLCINIMGGGIATIQLAKCGLADGTGSRSGWASEFVVWVVGECMVCGYGSHCEVSGWMQGLVGMWVTERVGERVREWEWGVGGERECVWGRGLDLVRVCVGGERVWEWVWWGEGLRVGGWGRWLESESGWVGEMIRKWEWVGGGEG